MFRCSGSVATYFFEGNVPDVKAESFLEALRNKRFRSIEHSASEETSIGWVTAGDPSGDSFELEDLDLDLGYHLRMRMDKKTLPAVWLGIYRSAAEKSAGRKLSLQEKRDLKQDLMSKLLPKTLPTVRLIDALYTPKRKQILLFASAKGVQEQFCKLFFSTFGSNLIAGDPYNLAARLGLGREQSGYLDQASPVPWPQAKRATGHVELAAGAAEA
ncbi:MAG: recombination-associated protein RdgC [Planctomycetota bacterium]|jgi:DNA recombination-dependent growth factor C